MSQDQETPRPPRSGSIADRSPIKDIGNMATASGGIGLLVGTADWLLKIRDAGHFVDPDNALVVMWMTGLAPIFLLIYKIIMNRLQKAAGDTP